MSSGDLMTDSSRVKFKGTTVKKALELLKEHIDNLSQWANSVEVRLDTLETYVNEILNARREGQKELFKCPECEGIDWYHSEFDHKAMEDTWVCAKCKYKKVATREVDYSKTTRLYKP